MKQKNSFADYVKVKFAIMDLSRTACLNKRVSLLHPSFDKLYL